jgi:hypothetical protein
MMGADSNCLTFAIDAFVGIEKPTDAMADQKIALARIFFYSGETFFTMPTVQRECNRIPDPVRRADHRSWRMVHFGVPPIRVRQDAIRRRARQFHKVHRKRPDCLILAEAKAAQLAILLSYDFKFIDCLSSTSNVILMKPLDCWNALGIPRGATPRKVPHATNPLDAHTWWRW